MKIKDLITEKNRSEDSKIVSSSKEAANMFNNAQKGKAGTNFDAAAALAKVRELYGVSLVDDYLDVFDPKRKSTTDKAKSLLTNSPRDKGDSE